MQACLSDLCQATHGRLTLAPGVADGAPVGRIVTDSRQVSPGEVFWALPGSHRNGADFAPDARRRGASGLVVQRGQQAQGDWPWVLQVDDPLAALWRWGKWKRDRFTGRVIAVTGSVGKTTTREMIHAVLGYEAPGLASLHNFNNHVGLPLTLSRLAPEHEYAVVELGASAPGEIARLAGLCRPHVAVITQIGDAHLCGFGSLQAIASSKTELLAALPHSGLAVLNGDDPWLPRAGRSFGGRMVWFGRGVDCNLKATRVGWRGGWLRFEVQGQEFRVPVWGRHWLYSALAAVAVGQAVDRSLPQIAAALADFQPPAWRCEVSVVGGVRLINDAYNACPAAMTAALQLLYEMPGRGRRVFVCGDMKELGQAAGELHLELGRQAVCLGGVDRLIACGEFASLVVRGARQAGMGASRARALKQPQDAVPYLARRLRPGDVVLVKGSRSMSMELLVAELRRALGASPAQAAEPHATEQHEPSAQCVNDGPVVGVRVCGNSTLPSLLGRSIKLGGNAVSGSTAPLSASRRDF